MVLMAFSETLRSVGTSVALAGQALRAWTSRQMLLAALASVVTAVVIGIATVLIPNDVFTREIPPVWWNYPVWLVTSSLSGMLLATYVRPRGSDNAEGADETAADGVAPVDAGEQVTERRAGRMGMAGGILAWFAVGCPVCNKLALLALGYSGAITWFAPLQPLLAFAALIMTGAALVWRLRGQVACPVRSEPAAAVR